MIIDSLKNQRTCPGMDAPKRTIGTYWPQVSTLIWYIRDAMPYAHPKSLTDDELYAMTAYLLAVNNIEIDGETMDVEYVLNREKFLKIKYLKIFGFSQQQEMLEEHSVPHFLLITSILENQGK